MADVLVDWIFLRADAPKTTGGDCRFYILMLGLDLTNFAFLSVRGAVFAGWAHSLLFGAEFGALRAQLPAKMLEEGMGKRLAIEEKV